MNTRLGQVIIIWEQGSRQTVENRQKQSENTIACVLDEKELMWQGKKCSKKNEMRMGRRENNLNRV